MTVATSQMTIADYCDELINDKIIVNTDYQRSNKVWPAAAKSYLIESIILGFPVPKFSLYSKTDLNQRRTVKEIIDGQQRSTAIRLFFENKMRITGKGPFAGKKYKDLEDEDKRRFIEYPLSIDNFLAATEEEIREVFRRINSYTVPLNPQEQRHAVHQGPFKWWVVSFTKEYSQMFKELGVFGEPQLSRMNDGILVTDLALALLKGLMTTKDAQLNEIYLEKNEEFPEEDTVNAKLERAVYWITTHREILKKSPLVKPYMLYSLLLAICHVVDPQDVFENAFPKAQCNQVADEIAVSNLQELSEALAKTVDEDGELAEQIAAVPGDEPTEALNSDTYLQPFVDACSSATNTGENRTTRFQFFCKAFTKPSLR